jgi:hypothetical protein
MNPVVAAIEDDEFVPPSRVAYSRRIRAGADPERLFVDDSPAQRIGDGAWSYGERSEKKNACSENGPLFHKRLDA